MAELTAKTLSEGFARQGFASTELITRWADIVGPEVAGHCEPTKIQWPRPAGGEEAEPATLVLRVEGPAAVEIQHLSAVILERVNRYFGWQAIGRLALRQAPLKRREKAPPPPPPDPLETARIAAGLSDIVDEDLRAAMARLGAAIKRN